MLRMGLGLLLVSVVACDDEQALELSVDLRTDFVAGAEFSGVRLELVGEGVVETDVADPVSYVSGRRVFDLDGLEPNERRVVAVTLLDPMSREVARREVLIAQSDDLAVTVVMTRDCASVSCPAAPGESTTSCLGGRCVDPRCVEGNEEVCLDPLCESDAECTPMNACAAPVCQLGVCLYEGLDACGAGTYCDPARGCVPLEGSPDGGPPAPPAPRVFYPPQGANTGTALAPASAELTIRWEHEAEPERFELEIDDSCPVAGYADCAFPSPEVQIEVEGTLRQVTRTLAVSTAVPVGTRYTYRLRACASSGCSPWTRPRHVNVGRLGNDLDGDGDDEVTIGATHRIHIAQGGSRSPTGSSVTNPFADDTSGFGRAIASADLDGDGFVDLVVGAPFDRGYGSIAIYRGSAEGAMPWTQIQGPPEVELNDRFGDTVCVGDVDGDGFGDVVVASVGGAFLLRGTGADFGAPEALDLDGAVTDCADVDHDGFMDVLVGTAFHPGGPGGLGAGVSPSAFAPYWLGDLDGDGRAEYAGIGRGSFPVHWSEPGELIGTSFTMLTASFFPPEWQVHSIANDSDGDGFGDSPLADAGASAMDPGEAAVLYGAAEPGAARVEPLPGCSDCRMGWAVSAGLDVDGDGLADFAIGAPDGGFVEIWFGNGAAPLDRHRLVASGAGFGFAL